MQISDINIKLNAKDDFQILLDLSMSNNLNCIRNNRKSYPRPWKGRQHSLDDARARIIALLTALLDDIMRVCCAFSCGATEILLLVGEMSGKISNPKHHNTIFMIIHQLQSFKSLIHPI